jgi:microcin C transport system substrate-binding protein
MGHWFNSYDVPALERGWIKRETRPVTKFIGMQALIAFNTNRERFRDVRVREALTLVLDFEWQNRVFHHSSQERALSYFANSQFAATGAPSGAELALLSRFRDQLDGRVFTEPFTLPVSPGRGQHREGLKRARSLLAAAGWQVEAGRLVNTSGEQFQLDLLTQNPAYRRILLPYVAALKLLGIDVRLRLADSVLVINLLRERNYDAYLRGGGVLNPPVAELRGAFHSKTADIQMSWNMAGIRNPIVDALIEEAERAGTIEAATTAIKALDRVLLWGFYHVPLHATEDERFLLWDKFGRPEHEAVARFEHLVGSSLRVIDGWWFDTQAAAKLAIVGK